MGWVRRQAPVLGVLAFAAIVRLALLTSTTMRLDGDEAVTGLVARRILDGEHRAFFPGQDYMGTLEQYLQAGVLAVLPDTDVTLRLVQVAIAVACCACVRVLALRCGLGPRRALLAAALFAAGPYFPAYWGTKSRGAYAIAMLIGLLGLIVALDTQVDDRRRVLKVAAFGLLCGVGVWNNQQVAYLLVPAGWWLLATVWRRWLTSGLAFAVGFLVGFAPNLWRMLDGGKSPLDTREGSSTIAERADHLLRNTLPDVLGILDDGEPLAGWLPPAFVVLLVVGALGAAVASRAGGIARIAALRTEGRNGVDLLLLALLVAPLLYVQSSAGTTATARYVLVLYGIFPVLLAALPLPRRWIKSTDDAVVAGALLVFAFFLHTGIGAQRLIAQDDGGHDVPGGQIVENERLGSVVDALAASGAETAYAHYWLALPLTWEADGQVLVESLRFRRIPDVTEAVEADPSPALVVSGQEAGDVRDALAELGSTFDEQEVEGWALFTGIEPGVHLERADSVADALRLAAERG